MCCIGNTTGFAYILAIRLGQHAWNQMGLAAHTQGCSNTSRTHKTTALLIGISCWVKIILSLYYIHLFTCHFKPQYRKLLSIFWTVSSAKDTNNKSGAHLSYASVPSSFWHAQGCHETCSPPRNWTIFHTPPVTSGLHEEAAALMARLQIYPTKSNVKEFGIGMPRVQQTANIPKYPKSILAWNHIRINEHLQPQLASRGD